MAIDDTAVVIPGTGHFLLGDVATATKPTQAALDAFVASGTPIAGYTDLGHTDLDEILAFGNEGGDTEVKGSWQNKSLREVVTDDAVDYLTVKALQVRDNNVMSLYYGGGNDTVEGEFSLPDVGVPQEKALLVVMNDAEGAVGLHVAKASIRREGSIETASDDFMKFPLRATFLKKTGSPRATWIADGLGTAA